MFKRFIWTSVSLAISGTVFPSISNAIPAPLPLKIERIAHTSKDSTVEQAERPRRNNVKAMTWKLLQTKKSQRRLYGLFGSDEKTNPYQGDTAETLKLPILCIAKENLPKPKFIKVTITPGGATRGSWSGARVFLTNPIRGTAIASQAEGDRLCNLEANQQKGARWNGNYRMAEFHDGDRQAGWVGWDFWADLTYTPTHRCRCQIFKRRYWVAINDQLANPWN